MDLPKRTTLVAVAIFLFPAEAVHQPNTGRKREQVSRAKCLDKSAHALNAKTIVDYKGKPLDFFQKPKDNAVPLLMVMGHGNDSNETVTDFVKDFMVHRTFQDLGKLARKFFSTGKEKLKDQTDIFVLVDLNPVVKNALAQIEKERPKELRNALAKGYSIADQVAPGLLNRVARRKAAGSVHYVFQHAFPAISMGTLAKGLLEGGKLNGKEEKGAFEQLDEAQSEKKEVLASVSAKIQFGLVVDQEIFSSIKKQAESAIRVSNSATYNALYRTGLFGRTRLRRRVWRSGSAGRIQQNNEELVSEANKAIESYQSLLKHTNDSGNFQGLITTKNDNKLEVLIVSPKGHIEKRFMGDALDTGTIVREYQAISERLKSQPSECEEE